MKELDKVKEALQNKINELLEYEWQAKEAGDYATCLQLYGATIHLKKFLKEIEED